MIQPHLPTLRQLQYLAALADQGSFSKAATRCAVTQSTLSAGIRDLETLLGHPVADRTQRQATLTALGRDVLEDARTILDRAAAITARARAAGERLSGPLRMGIIPTIAPYLLPRLLPRLQKACPALDLRVTEDLSARLVERLRAGRLDVLLLALPYATPGLAQAQLFAEPFYLACPHAVWAGPVPVQTAALEGQTLLLLEEGHCLRDHALAACRFQAQAGGEAPFSATSLSTLIQFVRNGHGLTLLPEMAAEPELLPDGIDVLPFADPPPTRKIGLAWRTGHPQEEDFRALGILVREA